MTRMTGGQAVVRTLRANGVSVAFGIPGMHNLAIYDAMHAEAEGLRHILARHEGGAGFMANGYARTGGQPGVAVVTTGPGACNIMCPLADAYRDSVPLLVIASQIRADLLDGDRGAFHEMRDQLGMAAGAAGWARRATSVEQIPEVINGAWSAMTEGRPRPAYVEIPVDVLTAEGEAETAAAPAPAKRAARPEDVAEAARLLGAAERPLVYAGGGVRWARAADALRLLAEALGAPVAVTCNGKGEFPDDHPLAVGYARLSADPYREIWRRSDAVLAVGAGFGEIATGGWSLPNPDQLIRIDVDAAQLGRNMPAAVALHGDAALVLRQLVEALPGQGTGKTSAWVDYARALRRGLRERAAGCDGLRLVEAMSAALGRTGISIGDAASVGMWQLCHLPAYEPGSFSLPLGFGTLGFGVPTALGAQAARPDRRVICLCGDGGFLFHGQELATAVQHGLNVVTVVVNDRAFGSIRRLQERRYGGRIIGADLVNPDFAEFARACGAFGARVAGYDEMPEALAAAFASGKPAVIEAPGPVAIPPT